MRIIIAGVPSAGKTTRGQALQLVLRCELFHTDNLIKELSWSEMSGRIANEWISRPGPWIIEGMAAVRGLRKWMRTNEEKPCDRIEWLGQPFGEHTPAQANMAKGATTMWNGIELELRQRGVEIL